MIFAAEPQTAPELAQVLHQIGQEASWHNGTNLTRVDLFPIHNFHQVCVTIPLLKIEKKKKKLWAVRNFAMMEQLQ